VRKHAEWEPCALPPAASADSHAAAAGAEDAAARFTVVAHERAGAPNKWEWRKRVLLTSGNRAERARRSG
jgi:hypothetical protein